MSQKNNGGIYEQWLGMPEMWQSI